MKKIIVVIFGMLLLISSGMNVKAAEERVSDAK